MNDNIFRTIKLKIRRFVRYVVKVIQYAIYLKDDHDWDHAYILGILKYKISRTRKYMEKYGYELDPTRKLEGMKRAEYLLEKIIEDDFDKDLYEAHYEKYGKSIHEFVEIKDDSGLIGSYRWLIKHENAITDIDKEQERADYKKLVTTRDERKEEAMNELFSLLRNEIEYWWD